MRNKEEFSWIICLLLMEYALSEDTCERSTCLGQLSFGDFLPRSAFTTKYQISLYQCASECWLRRQRCKSFNYRRSALSCQLCEEDSGPGGKYLQPKAGSVHSNIDTWTNIRIGNCNAIHCSWTERCDSSKPDDKRACVPTECPFAVLKPGVSIEPTNETSVGTKARYRCVSQNMERGDPISTCLESRAEWSTTDFKCVCETPLAKSGTINEKAVVEVGQNYTYRCQDGLFGKSDQKPIVTCLPDGSWTSTIFSCVCTTPPVKSGAINETAEVEVGQNYTYKCQGGLFGKSDQNPTVTCLEDGNWTSTNFICVCKTPSAIPGAINETPEVEVGQNYTYRCQDGLFGKGDQNPTVTCQHDGSWTSTNFICVQQNWMQDTIYRNNMHKSDVINTVTGIDLLTCMQQCDDKLKKCLSFFYDNNTSNCVLSSSFRRGLPWSLQSSDGLVYYTAPSTSCDMEYTNVSLGGSYFCIKYRTDRKDFNQSMQICESEKAKLLVVTTQDQIADVKTFLGNSAGWPFLGMSDETNEGHWVSWDGKVVSPYWCLGQPKNDYNKEDCTVVASDLGCVFALSCNWDLSFLCHKPICDPHQVNGSA